MPRQAEGLIIYQPGPSEAQGRVAGETWAVGPPFHRNLRRTKNIEENNHHRDRYRYRDRVSDDGLLENSTVTFEKGLHGRMFLSCKYGYV
jgi:hypothetical protein